MSLRELLMETTRIKKDVDEQITRIDAFLKTNSGAMDLVQSEISGGSKGYDQRMRDDLAATEKALKNAQETLQRASDSLLKVSQI